MITKQTVLILGAGASMPFGYPSGLSLVESLCDMNESPEVLHALQNGLSSKMSLYREFQSALFKSGRISVDAFLEHNPRYIDVGKIAIASRLIPYEYPSNLFRINSWYKTLFNRMNARVEDFTNNRLSIITYNYDRSLESFLLTALCHAYEEVNYAQAVELLGTFPIIHLHGKLSELPKNDGEVADGERVYSPEVDNWKIMDAAKGIRIIHEDIGNDKVFTRARELIHDAERVCFLGFGYDDTNLKRLGFPSDLKRNPQCGKFSGTTYKLGLAKTKRISNFIPDFGGVDNDIDTFLEMIPVLY